MSSNTTHPRSYRTVNIEQKYIDALIDMTKRGISHTNLWLGLKEKFPSELNNENASNMVQYFNCHCQFDVLENKIESTDSHCFDTYEVTFANDNTETLTASCLYHCYLKNELNKDSVISYEESKDVH